MDVELARQRSQEVICYRLNVGNLSIAFGTRNLCLISSICDFNVSDVIHTVGPQGEKPDKLKACYENSLAVAKEKCLRTIAFPCISTGVYGYPQRPAAKVALSTVKKFLLENKDVRAYIYIDLIT